MNKALYILILPAFWSCFFVSCNKTDEKNPELVKTDSISMGADYANDIYYSLSEGLIKETPNSEWDIAFSTPLQTATILINESKGMKSYIYRKGRYNDFDIMDTSGIYLQEVLYNDKEDIYKTGALNRTFEIRIPPFNYGWGTYRMQDHNVYPDSAFFLQLADGSFIKFAIKLKEGNTNSYYFKWADLNGDKLTGDSIYANNYLDKRFVYYDLSSKEIIDREPDKENWDLLFTRYHRSVEVGSHYEDYIVTGVLFNKGIEAEKVEGILHNEAIFSEDNLVDNTDVIGDDWKIFDPVSFTYSIDENLTYFIKLTNDNIYKFYFHNFEGASTGKIVFSKALLDL